MTDTVGFIHKLPHQLVDAFRATLEEVNRADVLVEVVDAVGRPRNAEHRATVQTVLDELGAGDKPRLVAFNKADLLDPGARRPTAGAGGRRLGARLGGDRLRPGHAAGRDCGAPGVAVGGHRRRGAVRGGRAAGAGPRARHGRVEYRERDVRVTRPDGTALAGELRSVADAGRRRWPPRAWRPERPDGRRVRPAGRHGPDGDRRPGRWSVADGRRGRRWREAIVGEGGLRHSLLLETAPDGAFSHLELATPAGLLTLHPEGDGTLHGNAIEAGGIRHVVGLPWEAGGVVDIEGSPVAGGAAPCLLAGAIVPGASARRTLLRVTAGLLITTGPGIGRADRRRDVADRRRPAVPRRRDGLPLLADSRGVAARTTEPATDPQDEPRDRGLVVDNVDKIDAGGSELGTRG